MLATPKRRLAKNFLWELQHHATYTQTHTHTIFGEHSLRHAYLLPPLLSLLCERRVATSHHPGAAVATFQDQSGNVKAFLAALSFL